MPSDALVERVAASKDAREFLGEEPMSSILLQVVPMLLVAYFAGAFLACIVRRSIFAYTLDADRHHPLGASDGPVMAAAGATAASVAPRAPARIPDAAPAARTAASEPVQRFERALTGQGTATAAPAPAPAMARPVAPSSPTPASAVPAPAPAPAAAPAPAPALAPMKPAPAPMAAKPMAKATGAGEFTAEAEAKSHCPSDTVVWVNTKSKVFHYAGHPNYGNTKKGAYMCEADATAAGDHASKSEKPKQ